MITLKILGLLIAADAGNTVDLRGANLCNADLRNANLCGVNLRNADLRDANLCNADLRDADLRDADLCGANLCGVNLRNADLRDADLCNANLCNADLRDADLCNANLCNADLRNANLCGVNLRNADLRDANLHGAKNNPLQRMYELLSKWVMNVEFILNFTIYIRDFEFQLNTVEYYCEQTQAALLLAEKTKTKIYLTAINLEPNEDFDEDDSEDEAF